MIAWVQILLADFLFYPNYNRSLVLREVSFTMIMRIIHFFKKRELNKFVEKLSYEPENVLAESLIALYGTRDCRLSPDENFIETLRLTSETEEQFKDTVESMSIRIFHYQPGHEVPLLILMDIAERKGQKGLRSAFHIHLYTNLATTHSGYLESVRKMWEHLFKGASELPAAYKKMFPDDILPDNSDIKKKDFLENPRLIIPHFLLPDSPITQEIANKKELHKWVFEN